jgi:hypothetical protein
MGCVKWDRNHIFLPEVVTSEGSMTGVVGHEYNCGVLIGKLNIRDKIFESEDEQIFVHLP